MALLGAQFVNAVSPSPVGVIEAYAGASAPSGWLLCDGAQTLITAYPELYSVLGTTYGALTNGSGGAGSTHFRVPDLRGRMPMGAGTGAGLNSSGTGAPSGTAMTARSLGQWGGEETHLNTASESGMPQHGHGIYGTQGNYGTENGFAHTGRVVFSRSGGPGEGSAYNFPSWALYGSDASAVNASSRHNTVPPFLVTAYIIKAVPDAPRSGLAYGSTPPIVTALPSNPQFGDVVTYKHTATGNIGALLSMQYDGVNWKPVGEAILCRWNCGNATQVFSATAVTNVTVGDYNTVTFTPPWNGYYEISQKTGRWELNSGIGMQTLFSATDGSEHYQLHYVEDWNGPYQHHREGHGMPIVFFLSASKTYRFTANLSYAAGNTGTIDFYGTAHVRAVSR